jgi:hypothetical protein
MLRCPIAGEGDETSLSSSGVSDTIEVLFYVEPFFLQSDLCGVVVAARATLGATHTLM